MNDTIASVTGFDRTTSTTLRGVVAERLVRRAAQRALGGERKRVLDLGGHETLAAALAAGGHRVVVVAPEQPVRGPGRNVEHVVGDPEEAADLVGGGFDAVFCHGPLTTRPSMAGLLRQMVRVAAPGALLSLTGLNADGLPFVAAMRDRWDEVSQLLSIGITPEGRVAVPEGDLTLYADYVSTVESALAAYGALVHHRNGLQVFTGHRTEPAASVPAELVDRITELEWRACVETSYMNAARSFHLIGRRARADEAPTALNLLP